MTTPLIILHREKIIGDVTLGRVEIGGPVYKFFATLEPHTSPMPQGSYQLRFEYSPRFKRSLWEVFGVPGHSEIKFHNGNFRGDTEGCPLLGLKHGFLNGEPAVISSRRALEQFHAALALYQGQTLELEVIDAKTEI